MNRSPLSNVSPARRGALAGMLALLAALAGLAVATAWAPAAGAHTVLLSSDPASGATLDSSPAQVVLTFNEPVQASTLQFAVTNSAGATVSQAPPAVAGTVITQPLPALPNDTYTVAWRLVSVDGHPVTDSLSFVLNDPDATTSAEPDADGTSPAVISPAPTQSGDSGGIAWKIGASAGILLVLVLLWASVSRSRTRRARRAEPPTESPDRPGRA